MSKLSGLKNRIHSLNEINDIIGAMKNLSLMELAKLGKYVVTQDKVVSVIEDAAADFMAFNPVQLSPLSENSVSAYIIIGSERGFCGNFNEVVIDHFKKDMGDVQKENYALITVGRKLSTKMNETEYAFDSIDGPNSIEEIRSVILNLVKAVDDVNRRTAGKIHLGSWKIIYNGTSNSHVHPTILTPFQTLGKEKAKTFSIAPLLNLTAQEFLSELLDNYFFAVLHQVFYNSFTAENRQRLLHMEGAIQWLENKTEELVLNYNHLRQEEITEEIEVILLSAKAILEGMNLNDFQ